MKHTKGKWMVAKAGKYHYQVISDKPSSGRMGDMDDTLICDISYPETAPEEEIEANAKLITAAPDLLLELISVRYSLSVLTETIQQLDHSIDNAIKKATQ